MSSTEKQQQQRRNNHHPPQQSRNTNAYFDRDDEYYRRSNYWSQDYDDYYPYRSIHPIRKGRQMKNEQRYQNIPPRHREQRASKINHKHEEVKSPHEQPIKPLPSTSMSSTNSENSNHAESTHRKDLHAKNLAAAAIAARQQNSQPQTNLNVVQTLMNSLILQQQRQQHHHQSSSQSQSTVQLQYQLTNALLATMIQQRLKEAALQAQAQQIQAAIPTLLAAQALVYQQSASAPPATPSVLPANVAHPGTKFNNRPLVKFPIVRPTMMMPVIRPPVTTNLSHHRLGTNTQSTTVLPTYQQVQEIERGISLDDAIHLKGAINVTDAENNPTTK